MFILVRIKDIIRIAPNKFNIPRNQVYNIKSN